jgi:hypothetical protein
MRPQAAISAAGADAFETDMGRFRPVGSGAAGLGNAAAASLARGLGTDFGRHGRRVWEQFRPAGRRSAKEDRRPDEHSLTHDRPVERVPSRARLSTKVEVVEMAMEAHGPRDDQVPYGPERFTARAGGGTAAGAYATESSHCSRSACYVWPHRHHWLVSCPMRAAPWVASSTNGAHLMQQLYLAAFLCKNTTF